MNINEIDKFRNNFFDKERVEKLAQKNCFHKYSVMGPITQAGYQERTCPKCGHSTIKSVRVWEGSKNGECIIA
jgi:hypothetical protein